MESWFLLQNADGRVKFWHQQNERMEPTCPVLNGEGGIMVWGMFSWNTLGPLIPIEYSWNITAYLSIVADHVQYVHAFMATIYLFYTACFKHNNGPYHKSCLKAVPSL